MKHFNFYHTNELDLWNYSTQSYINLTLKTKKKKLGKFLKIGERQINILTEKNVSPMGDKWSWFVTFHLRFGQYTLHFLWLSDVLLHATGQDVTCLHVLPSVIKARHVLGLNKHALAQAMTDGTITALKTSFSNRQLLKLKIKWLCKKDTVAI